MLKKLACPILAIAILCFIMGTVVATPLPGEDFDRQQAIENFFKDIPDNSIAGIWISDDNKYEIAITKNDFSVCDGYDYIGFVTQTTDPVWNAGKIKLQLKATAIPKLYTGLLHKKPNGYLNITDEQALGTTFVIANNTIGYIGERRDKKYFFRIYPGNSEDSAATRAGTGFFITPGLIVTSYHVVDDAKNIEIKYHNGHTDSATVVSKDPVNDLALLKVSKPESSVSPLPIAGRQNIKYGDAVYTIGFPMPTVLGGKAKLSEGIINGVTGIQDDVRMYQISIPIQAGNSGGPLLNAQGQVVGIVTATVNPVKSLLLTGSYPQNVNFAMKVDYVNNLLTTLPEKVRLPASHAANNLSPAEVMSIAREAVVQITIK